jgi:hypothetical protein
VSVSTRTPTPGTTTVPGAGAYAEPPTTHPGPVVSVGSSAHDQAFARAAAGDYFAWLAHVRAAAGCSHPIQLHGEIATINPDTGQLLSLAKTVDMPDGVIYKACGNRRASVCPSCAETYRRDAFELIRTGLVGGKGVPDTVSSHPAVFVTLTAPGFGPVHTRRTSAAGKILPCRPRRLPAPCPHGVDVRCHRLHAEDEKTLGTPLCMECYDYDHQVVWNNHAGELWRRTRITLDRTLNRHLRALRLPGGIVRLRYAKVAEMQRRGVVHFHAIIRLDGHHPDLPDLILPPPPGVTVAHLQAAITEAVAATGHTTPGHPHRPEGWRIGWGDQVDIRPIHLTGDGELTDTAAAGYLAKYATKSTETTGHTSRTLTGGTIDLYADPDGTHPERLIHAAWTLGGYRDWQSLRRWAHMLGFGGHFLTKARHYSITFTHLRQRRITWRRNLEHTTTADHDHDTVLVLNWLSYTRAGWKTPGDALLANTAAALARERHQAARDALITTH